jgi:hypothetical protein
MIHIATFLAAALGLLSSTQNPTADRPPMPACKEGVSAAKALPLPVAPPTFVRRAESPRLMIFIHGLQGDGTTSWANRSGVYWPSLVANDDQIRDDFDVFVYEYIVRTKAPIRLSEAAEELLNVAYKSELISKYRDVVFVTEGDGVFLVRELLRRAPPLAKRISMIFVVGRVEEASHPLEADQIRLLEDNRVIGWREFRINDAMSWTLVDPQPWTNCVVLSGRKQGLTERDEGSSFCSTMPIAIPGSDWQALRPSCYGDPVHDALRKSIDRRAVPTAKTQAPPAMKSSVSSKPFTVACDQVLESFVELPFDFDPGTEELLSVEATVISPERLKAQRALVDRVLGKVAIVKFLLVGPDVSFQGTPPQPTCAEGRATIQLQVLKRAKG